MLLALGSAVIEVIPSIFSHILLLTDMNYLSYLFSQTRGMWFVAASNNQSLLRYSHLYDVCFDLDTHKMYASDATAVFPRSESKGIETVPVFLRVEHVGSAHCESCTVLNE